MYSSRNLAAMVVSTENKHDNKFNFRYNLIIAVMP